TSLIVHLLLAAALVAAAAASWCQRANWWRSFDRAGLSRCPGDRMYVTGFYRNARKSWSHDPIQLLEEAECCSPPAPWVNSKTQTHTANWWLRFDWGNTWVDCPPGYFVQGLFRSEYTPGKLHNIEEARCSKPADHPNYYGHCYNADVLLPFDNKGLSKCQSGYYVTGLYRSSCDELYCIESLRCCSMASRREVLDDLAKAKTRVMDTTMADIARLGYYLGYGCKVQFIGEDFSRHGDTWSQIVDENAPCDNRGSNWAPSVKYGRYGYAILHAKFGSGYRAYTSSPPLSINYAHWGFRLKGIKYETPAVTQLPPEVIESGTVYNNFNKAFTKRLSRCVTSTRSVTHVQLNPWKNYRELNLQIPYRPTPDLPSYGFNYVTSSSTTDRSQNTQDHTFTKTFYKTIAPHSAARWNLLLSKTRRSVAYTATIEIRFSAELQGFLRWGEGSRLTNYHSQYHGSRSRPICNYRFGNQNTGFRQALRSQSSVDAPPWLWNDLRHAYKSAQGLINDLTDGRRYVFKLSGRFDDVIGTKVDVAWHNVPRWKRSEQSLEERDAGDDEAVKNIYHVARDLSFDLGAAMQNLQNQDRSLDSPELQIQDRSLGSQELQIQDRSLDSQELQNQDRSLNSQDLQNQDRSLDSQDLQNQDRSLNSQDLQNQDRSL
ncbi:unnamed protein product, partial [Lymnaea stagnalis]